MGSSIFLSAMAMKKADAAKRVLAIGDRGEQHENRNDQSRTFAFDIPGTLPSYSGLSAIKYL